MLLMHEVHKVNGTKEDDFEAAYRDGWMPMLAAGDDARLLWYTNHAHGSGMSYNVVTVTAVAGRAGVGAVGRPHPRRRPAGLDAPARPAPPRGDRQAAGPAALVPAAGGRLRPRCPSTAATHEPTMYMEDTMWPYEGKLHDYIEACGQGVLAEPAVREHPFIAIESASQPAFGSQTRGEVTLMQRIHKLDQLAQPARPATSTAEHRGPGTWMHDALGRPRSVGEQAAAHVHLVTAVLADGGRGSCCSSTRPTASTVATRTSSRPPTARAGCRRSPKGDDARLLWYTNHAHGSGVAYNVVTVTGVRDAAAWETLGAARPARRPARNGRAEVDGLRHDVKGKILLPVHWSPMQEIDLARCADRRGRARAVVVHGGHRLADSSLDDYIQCWYDIYYEPMQRVPPTCSCSTSRPASRSRTGATSGARRSSGRRSATTTASSGSSATTSRPSTASRGATCTTR